MTALVNRLGWIVVVAVLVGALAIFGYNIAYGPAGESVSISGDKRIVDPVGGPPVTVAEGVIVGPSGLLVPAAGVGPDQLVDTFTQARAGGARVHDAIDIMAPAGTPVLAAAPGRLEKLFFSEGGGGNTLYVRSSDGRWSYYYAHLQGYAPGLREGQKIARGQKIGTVGSSGNADPAGPHLHFAIHRMEPGDSWWEGTPVNPYPLLAAKPVNR
ncbi:MAG: M23 family metallopeptidase [Sphingomonas sp.]|nr:M23 family metallopeptidase [Sphingomonas sp.]